MSHSLREAQFEAQVEELKDRLHECLQSCNEEALAARGILEELIEGYQVRLLELRRERMPTAA